ncbi:MAG: hypothetical protein U1E35_00940 [Rhodospirillales bacterium]
MLVFVSFFARPLALLPTTAPLPHLDGTDPPYLDFVARHADMVGYSFVQRKEDVTLLQAELEKRRDGEPPLGIVAKIETQARLR